MEKIPVKVIVISHAGVKRINRAVYGLLKEHVSDVKVIVPSKLILTSATVLLPDPSSENEAEVLPMELVGKNPRTYFYPQLPQLLDTQKPDLIILENDPVSNLAFRLASWCRKNDCKLVCQTYDNTARSIGATLKAIGPKAIPKNLLIHLLNYRMASKISALLVVNNESKEMFQKYNYRNVVQIPLGYDKTVFFPDENSRLEYRLKLDVANETLLISFFGRLVRQKGAHLLIQALGAIRNLKWKLLLDYNHDSENQYSLYIRGLIRELGLQDRVIFFDADHYEIANYMRASDIMVAPSITMRSFKEQYGRAVQEAMACGCICVVSDSGHPKDLVGEKALIFPEGNVAAITAVLKNLITDADRRRTYKTRLQQRASGELSIDTQLKFLIEMIDNISGGSQYQPV